ncbi:MAG: HEPN domain-containing protein [Bacteroidota bacterium]
MIEKHLKALVVQHTKRMAPKIHDLEYLAELAGLELPVEELDFLTEMNGFNLEVRYPDEQLKIYKKATSALTKRLFQRTRKFAVWARRLVKR